MKEAKVIKGYWFLPDSPDLRIAGILTYIPNEKIKLELIGDFDPTGEYLAGLGSRSEKCPTIIHGESSDARKITMINCNSAGSSYNMSCSFAMQAYTAQYIIDGVYIDDLEQKAFHKIITTVPHLTSWVNHYALDHSISFKDDSMHGFSLGYSFDNEHVIPVTINENVKLEIEYVCSSPDKYNEIVEIKQAHQLVVETPQPVAFYNLVNMAQRFNNFLSMATLEPIDFTEISLYAPDYFQDLKNGRRVYHSIKLLFVQQKVEYKKRPFRDYLFDYHQISANFPNILTSWYGFNSDMSPIMQHLIESIQPKKIFSKADFLIVIQALEGFHTRFRNHKKVDLKDRIEELHQEFSFISKIKELKIDYKVAIDSRHYYSHFFHKSRKPHIADGEELYHLTIALKKILICCVLRETTFDDSSLISIIDGDEKIY